MMIRKSPITRTGILRVASHDLAAKPAPGPRPKTCPVCRWKFTPSRPGAKVCGAECAVALVELVKAKADRKLTRARKAAIKSRADHLKDAQAAFNAFIRARDALLPCVSCGRFHTGAWDAGHYRSVGAMPALRFCEINCHRQCVPCNQHKSGNIVEYRIGLVARIGLLSVTWLESDIHPAKKYTIEQAQAIRAEYKQKLKELA